MRLTAIRARARKGCGKKNNAMDAIAVTDNGTRHHVGASSTLFSNKDCAGLQKKALYTMGKK